MKATVSKDGALSFERTEGRIVKQYCPYQEDSFCGDWCPLFSIQECLPAGMIISLCRKEYAVEPQDFTDER